MTKMAATHFKNPSIIFFLQNQWTSFHETWYAASGTLTDHSLFKLLPWVDLDLFTAISIFCYIGFSIGKSENSGFFLEPIAACDHNVGRYGQLIGLMKICEYLRSMSFSDLGPK